MIEIEVDDEIYRIAMSMTKRTEQLEKKMSEMSDEERKIQSEEYDRFRKEVIRVFNKFK